MGKLNRQFISNFLPNGNLKYFANNITLFELNSLCAYSVCVYKFSDHTHRPSSSITRHSKAVEMQTEWMHAHITISFVFKINPLSLSDFGIY